MEVGTLCGALTEAAVQPHEAPTASFVGMQYLNISMIFAFIKIFSLLLNIFLPQYLSPVGALV